MKLKAVKLKAFLLTTVLAPLTISGWLVVSCSSSAQQQPLASAAIPNPVAQAPAAEPVSPDEPSNTTLNERFSLANSLERLQQIESALKSFQALTQKVEGKLPKRELAQVGNTDSETQNLGFHNWSGAVEGTLRKQNYQLKQLEFQLAQKQFAYGEIQRAELDQKERSFKQAEQDFQTFLSSFQIAD
ncbi:hypothetical protein [Leptolyngbya sp. FACHB-261]|uniref:hypothetical protein n=1 Tax=Leptolyngbya sp. FACHB-261 TaxID=2692806 RepID=UPI0016821D9B|nr:hypothetical protein [Leptolyngbya sp. FACHB-261]MBD2101529.1 hypothetical protein [Leptolyngbya sp. FACHB-261]